MARIATVTSLPPRIVLIPPTLGIRIRPPLPVVIDTAFVAGAETSTGADLALNILLAQIGEASAGADASTGLLLAGVGDASSGSDATSGIGLAATDASSGAELITQIGVGAAEVSSGVDGGLGLMVVVGESSSATDVTTAIFVVGIGEAALLNEAAFGGVVLALRIVTTEFTRIVETRER